MNWALFRKDLRLLRVPFITGLVILAGAYLVGMVIAIGVWGEATRDARRAVNDIAEGRVVAYAVVPAALVALGLTAFLSASFGGGAFAIERRDRSAEFLAMLPVPRWRIVASKLLAVLSCLLIPCAAHLAVVFLAPLAVDPSQRAIAGEHMPWVALRNTAAMTLMLFGVAWLMSALLDSAALAATLSVGVTTATAAFVGGLARRAAREAHPTGYFPEASEVVWALINPGLYRHNLVQIYGAVQAVTAVVGALALVAGTVIYLRRVSP